MANTKEITDRLVSVSLSLPEFLKIVGSGKTVNETAKMLSKKEAVKASFADFGTFGDWYNAYKAKYQLSDSVRNTKSFAFAWAAIKTEAEVEAIAIIIDSQRPQKNTTDPSWVVTAVDRDSASTNLAIETRKAETDARVNLERTTGISVSKKGNTVDTLIAEVNDSVKAGLPTDQAVAHLDLAIAKLVGLKRMLQA